MSSHNNRSSEIKHGFPQIFSDYESVINILYTYNLQPDSRAAQNNTNGSYPSSMSSQPARRLTRVNTNYWRRSANPYTKSNWAEMSRRSARSYLLATVCVGTWICTVNRGVYFTWASQVSAVIVFLLRLAPVRQVVIIFRRLDRITTNRCDRRFSRWKLSVSIGRVSRVATIFLVRKF